MLSEPRALFFISFCRWSARPVPMVCAASGEWKVTIKPSAECPCVIADSEIIMCNGSVWQKHSFFLSDNFYCDECDVHFNNSMSCFACLYIFAMLYVNFGSVLDLRALYVRNVCVCVNWMVFRWFSRTSRDAVSWQSLERWQVMTALTPDHPVMLKPCPMRAESSRFCGKPFLTLAVWGNPFVTVWSSFKNHLKTTWTASLCRWDPS